MKGPRKLALLASLVLGITLSLGTSARADHEIGHNHPFCAQGGGQAGDSSGGPGGTIPPEGAASEDLSGGEVARNVLVPQHLGERFGEDFPLDPDAQFIEVDADEVAGDDGGSNGSAFHGGHGGGPGGGQGGSTFFGAGDGGCSPITQEAVSRPPSGRLPVTGTSAEQFALMGGVFLILGGTFVFAPQIVAGVNKFMGALFGRGRKTQEPASAEHQEAPEAVHHATEPAQHAVPQHPQDHSEWAPEPEAPNGGQPGSAVERLRQEINTSWTRSGDE